MLWVLFDEAVLPFLWFADAAALTAEAIPVYPVFTTRSILPVATTFPTTIWPSLTNSRPAKSPIPDAEKSAAIPPVINAASKLAPLRYATEPTKTPLNTALTYLPYFNTTPNPPPSAPVIAATATSLTPKSCPIVCAMIKDAATLTAAPSAALTSQSAICPSSSAFKIGLLSQYKYKFLLAKSTCVSINTSSSSALINLQISGW